MVFGAEGFGPMRQAWKRLRQIEANATLPGDDMTPWLVAVWLLRSGMIQIGEGGRLFAPPLNDGWEYQEREARAWVKRLEAWRAEHDGAAIFPVTSKPAATGLELIAAGAMNPDPWAPVMAELRGRPPGDHHIPAIWPGEKAEPYTTLAVAMADYDRMRSAAWPDRTPVDVDDLRRWLTDALDFALEMER